MQKTELKTAAEWFAQEPYSHLYLVDTNGWPGPAAEFRMKRVRITEKEFKGRLLDCTIGFRSTVPPFAEEPTWKTRQKPLRRWKRRLA